MILLGLLRAVVDQLLDAGLDGADLCQDLVGGGGPSEGLGVGVPVVDVVTDRPMRTLTELEGAAADGMAGNIGSRCSIGGCPGAPTRFASQTHPARRLTPWFAKAMDTGHA